MIQIDKLLDTVVSSLTSGHKGTLQSPGWLKTSPATLLILQGRSAYADRPSWGHNGYWK